MTLDRKIKETNQRIDALMCREGAVLAQKNSEESEQDSFISWTQGWIGQLKYAFDGPSKCRGRMNDLYYPGSTGWVLPWE